LEQKIKHSRLRHIFISHLHGDHYFGLIGLLSSLNLNHRTEPLTLIGPPGLSEIITVQLKYSYTSLHFPLHFIETNPEKTEQIYQHTLFTVTTFPLIHRVPCNGYLITTIPSKRKIIKENLPENFPIPYIHSLKEGIDVTDELSGITYKVTDYTYPGEPPKRIAYCSDTAYYEAVVPVISQADLLFHEATFANKEAERAKATFHSTAAQAATIAQKAAVKQLIIGHYSSRYKELDTHLAEAQEIFTNTSLGLEGDTYRL
ncbi:MAG: ribonuclease Z, partial [Flavobacteriales bacterium]|nr:ribonuclease Z [Flavobacteriales bacterium]